MAIDLSGVLTAVLDQVIPFLELVAALIILGGGVWALTIFVRGRDAAQARHEFSHALAAAPDLTAAALAAGVTAVRIALTLTLLREEHPAASRPPAR